MPNEPEYIYAEKGKELKTLQGMIENSIARRLGLTKATEEKRGSGSQSQGDDAQEVDRILREQGLKGFYPQGKLPYAVMGRYVAVYPNPDNARSMEGSNRTLSTALADYLAKQKDVRIAPPDRVRSIIEKNRATGAIGLRQNLQALGDAPGVQALILTGVVPSSGKNTNFLVLEVYDTYKGTKVDSFVRNNALRVAVALMEVDWFGRVEFVKEGHVYLSLGDSTGLKVGDRLRVVSPGKEVVNPNANAPLAIGGDVPRGMLKITELLGTTGAVAQTSSGGPFKPNDKVKPVR